MEDIKKIQDKLERKSALQVIEWAVKEFGDKVQIASSFSIEDMVLTDLLSKVNPTGTVFTLDTGRLHQQTYDLMSEVMEKYDLKFKVFFPEKKETQKMVEEHGFNCFYKSIELRKKCCHVRKVEPLNRAFKGLDAWICGLRREQAVTRVGLKKIVFDVGHNNIYKLNPLADWTVKDLWDYIKKNKVPSSKLYGKNYLSIGCEPCTRPVKKGGNVRDGRWWWEPAECKECGLHI
jgi:phosphoadenosine phosphosulfate reductase